MAPAAARMMNGHRRNPVSAPSVGPGTRVAGLTGWRHGDGSRLPPRMSRMWFAQAVTSFSKRVASSGRPWRNADSAWLRPPG